MKKLLALLLVALLCLTCFAACKGDKTNEEPVESSKPTAVVYDVDDAAAYLKNMYKKYLVETETAADFTLVSQVMKSGVVYKITWATDREDIKVVEDAENKQVLIDLDEKTKVEIKYTLTATISDPDGKTATLSFELKVPKYVLSSWSEYMNLAAGKAVVIEGYVAAVHSQAEGQKYNMLYVHDKDNKGGYYIYSMTKDPVKDLGLKKGMLVSVTGTKDIYSGTHEIKDASVSIIDSTVTDFAPLDITNTYKNANSLKDEALVSKLGMLVTIKGVEITDQDLSEKSQYYNFKLSALTSYVRLYRTDCPCSVSDDDMKAIAKDHTAKKGYTADVTGVVVMYSGAIYLNPVDKNCFKYGSLIQRTDAEKVDVEIEDLDAKIEKDIAVNKKIDLPSKGASYENVAITWVSNSPAIEIKDGKAVITLQEAATTATITGTFKLNEVTKTHTITFKLAKKASVVPQEITSPVIGTAYKLFTLQENLGGYYYFTGEYSNNKNQYGKTSNDHNDAVDVKLEDAGSGKYYLTMGEGANKKYITVVSTAGTDSSGNPKSYFNFNIADTKPAVAFTFNTEYNTLVMPVEDAISKEKLDHYIGTYGTYDTLSASKLSYAATSFPSHLGTMIDTSKISDADKVAAEKKSLSIENDKFAADGSIDLANKGSIYTEVAITWASDNACAVVADGKLTVTLQDEAQTVKLTATLKSGSVTETKEFTITVNKKGYTFTTIPAINTIGSALENKGPSTTDEYFVTGIITEIKSTKYGNANIVDEFGNVLYVYGMYDTNGNRYDKLEVKPNVGDSVILLAVVSNYNGVQLKDAKIIEHTVATSITDANAIGVANPDYTADKYYVTGKITEIKSTKYGNIYIEDAEGNKFYTYGLYDSTGEVRYDAMETKPVVGDTITIWGVLGAYKGAAQMKDGWLVGYVKAPVVEPDEGEGEGEGSGSGTTTPGAALAVFEFGDNKDTTTHNDGKEIADNETYTSGNYSLVFTGVSKVYGGANDATGKSCIKLGTSKVVGTFTFTVPADVKSVTIKVAQYKKASNTTKISINGGAEQTITEATSDTGTYKDIVVDTTSTKTVTFATVTGGVRCMIDSITFNG